MPSVTATLLPGNVLEVRGDDNAQEIRVSHNGTLIWVESSESNGNMGETSAESFRASDVTQVKVYAYGGNDIIDLFGLDRKSYVRGGYGNDTIHGGTLGDSLYGDGDNDWLFGHQGDDTLRGGEGNDFLKGHSGRDILFGWTGNDTLVGEAGMDKLDGWTGNDRLEVMLNFDNLLAGRGKSINYSYSYQPGNGTDTIVVSLDLESFGRRFLKPIIDEVSAATYALQPVMDLLDREIPFLSELDAGLTFGDLLRRADSRVGQFIDTMHTIRAFEDWSVNWSGTVELGTFSIASGSMAINTLSSNAIGSIQSRLLPQLRSAGFYFHILENPRSAVRMMLGMNATLFEVKLPSLDVSCNYARQWDIPTGLWGVNIETTLGGDLRLRTGATIGLDTTGIRSGNLLRGLYLRNTYASLTAGLSASGALAVGIPNWMSVASAGIEGGLSGTLTFRLNDPNGDGKVHITELPEYYDDAFTISGQLDYGVWGFIKYWDLDALFQARPAKDTWEFYTGTLEL